MANSIFTQEWEWVPWYATVFGNFLGTLILCLDPPTDDGHGYSDIDDLP